MTRKKQKKKRREKKGKSRSATSILLNPPDARAPRRSPRIDSFSLVVAQGEEGFFRRKRCRKARWTPRCRASSRCVLHQPTTTDDIYIYPDPMVLVARFELHAHKHTHTKKPTQQPTLGHHHPVMALPPRPRALAKRRAFFTRCIERPPPLPISRSFPRYLT